MKIYFDNVGLFTRCTVKKVLNRAVEKLGQPSDKLEVSVSIVSPEEIKQLNAENRDVDSVTDVLSFPTIDAGRKVINVNDFQADVNPETGLLNLGDIVICMERAREQAEAYGHSLKREIAFLSLHGMLHLLGYDHMNEQDEEQMFSLQTVILEEVKITRN